MPDNELFNKMNNTLGFKHIKIKAMDKVDDYLFIILDNKQKILTNGKELYDVSEYNSLINIFNMKDKLCAVFRKYDSFCVVDLKAMEILYEDKNAYHISKQDERTLHIIMNVGSGNNTIYDIETKKYLPAPAEYEFEHSLGNNLYVFRETHDSTTSFYKYKRCVINAYGKILLKDIEGWIYLSGNHLIVIKNDEMDIIGINEESTLEMQTIKQNNLIIAKPTYHDGNIVIIEKEKIKIYTPNLELINEIKIDGLEEVIDYQIVSDTLKICLPLIAHGEQINKHLYINLKTGKSISHIRIEGYPYWTPTTYVGQDSIDSEITDFHFYTADFEPIISIAANSYVGVDSNKECMFVIKTINNGIKKRQLLNTENGNIKEIDYTYVNFHPSLPFGYGVNPSNETIDFFDENLNTIISGVDYKKFNLNVGDHGFSYFIVNNYVCIINHFIDAYGRSKYRYIIQNSKGNIVLDSIEHKCYAIGNLIQITGPDNTRFLNTLTGKIGDLSLIATIDKEGKIDFNQINDINNYLTINDNNPLSLLDNNSGVQKIKKFNETKDD